MPKNPFSGKHIRVIFLCFFNKQIMFFVFLDLDQSTEMMFADLC